ncbi:MAG: acyl-CoA dehydrogenase family protein [Acidimicrobiia bacterium]
MDLVLEGDQELLLDTTRRFLAAESPMTAVRALYEDEAGFDRGYWRRGAELGWTAMLVPEELGGGSITRDGLLDLALIAEEFGRSVAPGPLLAVNVVASALARSGTDAHRADVLPGLVSGELVATWAFAEGDGTWDAGGVALTATPAGDGWVLDGRKTFVQDAGRADWLLVTARTDGGLTQFLIPRAAPGLVVEPLVSLDMVRRFGHVRLETVSVGPDAVVGQFGGADDDVEHQLRVALVLQNAETVGAAAVLFDTTLEYCNDRVSFGRPIGSYQALKHRLAEMKLALEACLGTSTASAKAVQAGATDAGQLVRVAAAYIGEQCPSIGQGCIQLHGGIGVTWESDLHVYLRRIAQNAALYGSPRQLRLQLADLLGL